MAIPQNVKELLQHLESLESSLPPKTKKELALEAYREAQKQETEARRAFAEVKKEYQDHAETLKTLTLQGLDAYAKKSAELIDRYDAYADYVKYKAALAERARIEAGNTFQEPDPEPMKLRGELYNLKQVIPHLQWNDPKLEDIFARVEEIEKQLRPKFIPS